MEKGRKAMLKKVPLRTLVASVKRDLRRAIKASAAASKPKKG
jgi:hypothetical protein